MNNKKDQITIEGMTIEADQIYHSFCCAGFDYRIAIVFPYTESIWGVCSNPDCPNFHPDFGEDDPYRGVTSWSPDDFLDMLADGIPSAEKR